MTTTTYRRTTVELDDFISFPNVPVLDETWNGFAIPLLNRAELQRLIDALSNDEDSEFRMWLTDDGLLAESPSDDDSDPALRAPIVVDGQARYRMDGLVWHENNTFPDAATAARRTATELLALVRQAEGNEPLLAALGDFDWNAIAASLDEVAHEFLTLSEYLATYGEKE